MLGWGWHCGNANEDGNEPDGEAEADTNVNTDSGTTYLGIRERDVPSVIDWAVQGPQMALLCEATLQFCRDFPYSHVAFFRGICLQYV